MTQRELERLCKKWQRILRLEDWKVRPVLAAGVNDFGSCLADSNHRQAIIYVRDQTMSPMGTLDDDVPAYVHFPADEELTLVHELIHLHTESFAPSEKDGEDEDPRSSAHEFCVNAIADALVTLERKS